MERDDGSNSIASELEDDVNAWILLERESSVTSSEDGIIINAEETDNPSDHESDGSSIVVIEESLSANSSEGASAEVVHDPGAAIVEAGADEELKPILVVDEENNRDVLNEVEAELVEIKDKEDPNDLGNEEPVGPEDEPAEDSEPLQHKPPPDLLEVANRIDDMDQLDYSVTHQDLPAELNIASIDRTRRYVHQRNSQLNLLLNFVVAFTLAAVLGFGLGHFIGLSDNFPPRPGCSSLPEDFMKKQKGGYEGLSEAELRAELQKITLENIRLQESIEEKTQLCFSDKQDELLQENEDLKNTIGRMRYGKPVRSYEDRDTINRLETENQELRELVGKLRYSCKGSEKAINLSHWNLTDMWNKYILEATDKLNASQAIKEVVRIMENRWSELQNLSRTVSSPELASRVSQTFRESLERIVTIGSEFAKGTRESASRVVVDLSRRLGEVLLDLEKGWGAVKQKFDSGDCKGKARRKKFNEDWFLQIGRQREKVRNKEKRSDWYFQRASERGKERQRKSENIKNRKQNFRFTKHVPRFQSGKY